MPKNKEPRPLSPFLPLVSLCFLKSNMKNPLLTIFYLVLSWILHSAKLQIRLFQLWLFACLYLLTCCFAEHSVFYPLEKKFLPKRFGFLARLWKDQIGWTKWFAENKFERLENLILFIWKNNIYTKSCRSLKALITIPVCIR